jgi:hypothetical protein
MSVHPGPLTSGPPPVTDDIAPVTASLAAAADQVGSTSGGGRESDEIGSVRTCGRCRQDFPTGADVHPMELRDWWACPTCVDALMPTRGHRSPA